MTSLLMLHQLEIAIFLGRHKFRGTTVLLFAQLSITCNAASEKLGVAKMRAINMHARDLAKHHISSTSKVCFVGMVSTRVFSSLVPWSFGKKNGVTNFMNWVSSGA